MTRPERTVSARVPVDLHADLVELSGRRRDPDVSATIRWALRTSVDAGLAGEPTASDPRLFYAQPGPVMPAPRPLAKRAATVPGPGTIGGRALDVIASSSTGATVDEIEAHLEHQLGKRIPTNGLARRVTDLLQAGAITTKVALRIGDQESAGPLTRATRNGRAAQVYVATERGLAWRDENRAKGTQ